MNDLAVLLRFLKIGRCNWNNTDFTIVHSIEKRSTRINKIRHDSASCVTFLSYLA